MEKIICYPVFFTATVRDWKKLLKPEKYKDVVLVQLKEQVDKSQLIVYAYCVMDNHIHIIWQVKGDIDPSEVQKQFLEGCSKKIKRDLEVHHPNVLLIFIPIAIGTRIELIIFGSGMAGLLNCMTILYFNKSSIIYIIIQ